MSAGDSLSGHQFDPSAINRIQRVSPKWIMENLKPSDDPTWKANRRHIEEDHFSQYPEHWDEFRQSIRQHGVRRPITVSGDTVMNGHHRVIVAADEDVDTIPVRALRK